MERYLSVSEFAAITGYTKQAITKWCRQKKLTAIQPGGPKGAWRIHPKEVGRFEQEEALTE